MKLFQLNSVTEFLSLSSQELLYFLALFTQRLHGMSHLELCLPFLVFEAFRISRVLNDMEIQALEPLNKANLNMALGNGWN